MTFPTNADRAERVRQFIIDYSAEYGGDETTAVDVITDILHFVNLNGGSPAYVMESAYYTHYLAEVEEENQ